MAQYDGGESYYKSLQASISVSAGFLDNSFTASASFSYVEQESTKYGAKFITQSAQCSIYDALIRPYIKKPLTEEFVIAVSGLPTIYDHSSGSLYL